MTRTTTQLEFLRMVPVSARKTVAEMLRQPVVTLQGLRAHVKAHTLDYVAESALRRDLDPELARSVDAGCQQLLDLATEGLPADERAIVQAACEYYVFDADADSDFDGVTGLDDDAEVVNAALSVFGLDSCAIKIS